jgi:transcriptional regulator with XRE-family HTH domain
MPISESGLDRVVKLFQQRMAAGNLHPADVAAATGQVLSTVTRLLSGRTREPRWDTLSKLALYLELDLDVIMRMAYGQLPSDEAVEAELVGIYRRLSEPGRQYLLTTARGFLETQALAPKPTDVAKRQG